MTAALSALVFLFGVTLQFCALEFPGDRFQRWCYFGTGVGLCFVSVYMGGVR